MGISRRTSSAVLNFKNQRRSIKQISVFVNCHLEYQRPDQKAQLQCGWVLIQGPIKEVKINQAPEQMSRNPNMHAAQGILKGESATPTSQEV